MARFSSLLVAGALGLALGACSGGAGFAPGRSLPVANPGSTSELQTVSDVADLSFRHATASQYARGSIDGFNALGSRVKAIAEENAAESASTGSASSRTASAMAGGACRAGVEFFAPDQKGDPNSTETKYFYDPACTQLARDSVRIVTPTGSGSETIVTTTSMYAVGSATPIAMRTDTSELSNATFQRYGFPIVADGFVRETQSQLVVAGNTKSILSDAETVMVPSTTDVSTFCMDSAGFNAVGIPSLGLTFGWQGGTLPVPAPTRAVRAKGFVTWSATHSGTTEEAPIGGLSIAAGSPNAACPIAHPAYTLTGGTSQGAYTLPITATFRYGRLRSLRVVNATLANGDTLNAWTFQVGLWSGKPLIGGVIKKGSARVATFHVNAFGDGILTVTATGAQYVIVDWSVVRT